MTADYVRRGFWAYWISFFRVSLSQREFAEIVRRAFEESGSPGLEYREAEFALKFPGRDASVFLHNSYANFCSSPLSARSEVVSRLVAGFTATPDIHGDFAAARSHLMPAVRDAAYESLSQLLSGKEELDPGKKWQYRPLVDDLIVGLVYDTEHTITTVNHNKLNQWETGLDDALKIAKENLWERADPQRFTGKGGMYWGEWGDSYDSLRMLLTEFIYRLDVDGDPVAYIPNRDALMVTGKRNTAGLRVILNAGAETHFKSGHPLSPDLFLLENGVWKTYIPEDPALQEIWRSTRRNRDAADYSHQKQLLDKLQGSDGVFVASFMMFKSKDGVEFSACAWTKDVDTSMPRTEFVGLVTQVESKERVLVRGDDVMSVAGNLLEPDPRLIPPRYRARQFPSDEQMAQLRRVAK